EGDLGHGLLSPFLSPEPRLSLHRSGGEPCDDPALEDEHEQDDGDRYHDRGGGDRRRRLLELRAAGEERQRRRHGAGGVGGGERDGEEELVPGEDEDEDGGGEYAGGSQGCDHPYERLERGGPVDLGGLLQLPGDLPEECRE